jgi:hypothetical protein
MSAVGSSRYIEAEQAIVRLTKAVVLFADGDIGKPVYGLLRSRA